MAPQAAKQREEANCCPSPIAGTTACAVMNPTLLDAGEPPHVREGGLGDMTKTPKRKRIKSLKINRETSKTRMNG